MLIENSRAHPAAVGGDETHEIHSVPFDRHPPTVYLRYHAYDRTDLNAEILDRSVGKGAATPTELVERDQQLFDLERALERALARRGQLVFVSGEAGVGKSALGAGLLRQGTRVAANLAWRVRRPLHPPPARAVSGRRRSGRRCPHRAGPARGPAARAGGRPASGVGPGADDPGPRGRPLGGRGHPGRREHPVATSGRRPRPGGRDVPGRRASPCPSVAHCRRRAGDQRRRESDPSVPAVVVGGRRGGWIRLYGRAQFVPADGRQPVLRHRSAGCLIGAAPDERPRRRTGSGGSARRRGPLGPQRGSRGSVGL